MLLASACGGSEPPDAVIDAGERPAVTVEVPEAAVEIENVEPDVDKPQPLGDGDSTLYPPLDDEWTNRPVYDPDGDVAVYLRELVGWTMRSDAVDTIPQEAYDCYAESFIAALSPERVIQTAAVLDQQPLSYGFPLDIMTDEERTQLFVESAPCASLLIHDDVITALGEELLVGLGMGDPAFSDDEATTGPPMSDVLEGLDDCFTALLEDNTARSRFVEGILFDSPEAQADTFLFMAKNCGATYLVPMMVETFIAEDGLERETAECIAPKVLEAMLLLPAEVLVEMNDGDTGEVMGGMPSGSGGATDTATMEMMESLMSAFVGCEYAHG